MPIIVQLVLASGMHASVQEQKAFESLEPLRASAGGQGPLCRGFTCAFVLPFRRTDVFNELARPHAPLGVSPRLEISVTRSASCKERVDALALGCRREIRHATGLVLDECVVLDDGVQITWQELSNSLPTIKLVGTDSECPTLSIRLRDAQGGLRTRVTLQYSFHAVELPPLLPCASCVPALREPRRLEEMPASVASQLAETSHLAWGEDMRQRGHRPAGTGGVVLGKGFECSFALPYRRADVWAELSLLQSPLGSAEQVRYETLPGPRGEGGSAALGSTVRTSFSSADGAWRVVWECVELIPGVLIAWAQRSATGMHVRGGAAGETVASPRGDCGEVRGDLRGDGPHETSARLHGSRERAPRVTIALCDETAGSAGASRDGTGGAVGAVRVGTRVHVELDVARVSGCDEDTLSGGYKDASETWAAAMAARGYCPAAGPVEPPQHDALTEGLFERQTAGERWGYGSQTATPTR